MSRARRPIAALLAASAILFGAAPLRAATLFDPALRFRILRTEHFVIHFHQRESRLAQRLAVIAEETWHKLQRPLGVTPPPLTQVVLADQTELFNGYATPLAYDTIVLFTVSPSGSDFDFDDWLRIGFTHEFTHIVHLDRSEGWARVVRAIFGRTIVAFPNLFLPTWQIEGLATYEESVITGEGRLHAGDFRAIVTEAARQHRLEPLDRVNGGLTDWPGGATVYAYGVGFHQYLADRFGADRIADLAEATARSLPYLGSRAFKQVYGEPLGNLWSDYEASLTSVVDSTPEDAGIHRLTHQGFEVSGPRFDRLRCPECPADILYSVVNPNGFPAIYRVGLDGAAPARVTTRYLGSTTAIGRDEVYFDQMEVRRDVGVYSDLYAWSRSSGQVRQLSRDARLQDPDLSPDGTTIACVQNQPGQRDLVVVRSISAASQASIAITTLIAGEETQFDAPRWSPDGRTIAVERHRLGALPEIVLVDVATRSVRVLSTDAGARFARPAWRPDGAAVVAAMAANEKTFNLVELALDGSPMRQLTHTTGGATWPDVSPDGRTIVFVGYTTDGYDLFSMPYPNVTAVANTANGAAQPAPPLQTQTDVPPLPETDYSPRLTLAPTSWAPVVETGGGQLRVGASAGGNDVLGYHAYAATATWLASGPGGAPRPNAASPDWQVYYIYDRWRPEFYAAASSQTTFYAGAATAAGTPTDATLRSQQLEVGVVFPITHVRVQHAAQLSIVRAMDDYTLPDQTFTRSRTPVRAAWQTLTAHTYGYSVSPEDGIAAGVTTEFVRRALGSFADATTVTGDVRAYLPGFAPHQVLALRLAGGSSVGDPTVGRTFLLGGDNPGTGVADFDNRAVSLLRGFGDATFAGSHSAVMNAEYRFPIARPQRGVGTWPLFLHTIHAAVFADAGQAWTSRFRADAIKTSAGAELSTDFIAGYSQPFTLTAGAAWGHDGSGALSDRVTVYFRVGKPF